MTDTLLKKRMGTPTEKKIGLRFTTRYTQEATQLSYTRPNVTLAVYNNTQIEKEA